MGYALIWSEGLAVALLSLALATAWAARGGRIRALWVAAIGLAFFGSAALLVKLTGDVYVHYGTLARAPWFLYTLTWLAAFTVTGVWLLRNGSHRPAPGLARPAASWPRGKLWLGLGGAVLALGFTFWNLDLSARADLAIARQEAGALLLDLAGPPVDGAENAARVYAEAAKEIGEAVPTHPVPWLTDPKDSELVALVKQHEHTLTLLRQAAAMPRCNFDRRRSLLDAVSNPPERLQLRRALMLLAADARFQAAQGKLTRAFENVSAMLGIIRHGSELGLLWGSEREAWRTLEDVLRLAPAGKEPLPALTLPELPSLVRKIREEQTLLGMIMPAVASQPDLVLEEIRRNDGPWAEWLLEAAVVPARVFLVPDDLAEMRRLIAYYQNAPRSAREESPKDWAALRQSVQTDPTSLYGLVFTRPKFEKLLIDGSALATLRQTGRAGLAAAAYQRKHGRYPERLEQLAPEFLPAMPVDPRDGQPLRIRHFAEGAVIYGPQDGTAAEGGTRRIPEGLTPAPIFRLYATASRKTPE
jgi:hypothetical protein